jgi:acyl-CoA synthetase (AMP-forming)/AMP-acid ligase II
VGGSVVVLPAFDPEAYLAAVARYRVTVTTGVPAMYQMLMNRKELFARHDTRSVRFCFVGSAQVPYGFHEAIRAYFPNAHVRETYGSTEAGLLVQPPDGSLGLLPVPGNEVRVIRDNGEECAANEAGEIILRNPSVTRGYYKNPEATAERIRNGWYHSGDLVRCTEDGRYFVVGRKDDRINTGGENIYPKEIEDILLRHPKVGDACVVPVSHPIKGQVPVAFVVLRQPNTATESEIKEFYVAYGAPFAHPRRVFFIKKLPLSAPGKVDRNSLRAKAESTGGGDSKP